MGNSGEETLPRLDRLSKVRPRRVSKLIRLIWPDIQAALEFGHTLKFIHERLVEGGISISYNQLTVYVSRLRRESPAQRPGQVPSRTEPLAIIPEPEPSKPEPGNPDPLQNYRERCIRNPPGFRSEGGTPDKSKLI
jgi:hypothetical protein